MNMISNQIIQIIHDIIDEHHQSYKKPIGFAADNFRKYNTREKQTDKQMRNRHTRN